MSKNMGRTPNVNAKKTGKDARTCLWTSPERGRDKLAQGISYHSKKTTEGRRRSDQKHNSDFGKPIGASQRHHRRQIKAREIDGSKRKGLRRIFPTDL